MIEKDSWTELGSILASLQTHDAEALRVQRIRDKCLNSLEVQRKRNSVPSVFLAAWQRWMEPAAAFALSALYIAAAIGSTFRLFR